MSPLSRLLIPLLCLAGLAAEETNLLTNPGLAVAGGALAGWSGKAEGLAADAADVPAGIPAAVRLTVVGASGDSHGQLTQRLAVAKADAHYHVSAWTRSSAARAAYVQVKLYGADRKELKRITIGYAGTAWAQADAVVDASGAAAIEVLLRWIPDPKFDRATVWFAAPLLSETTAAPTPAAKPRAQTKPAADDGAAQAAAAKPRATIALVGDSTVQQYPEKSDRRGWGEMIGGYLASDVRVLNRAAGGRSTSTFRSEGLWDKVLAEKPDVVLIQFGHNDSHEAGRPEATDAGTAYRDNLLRYVADAKAAGIAVVLLTPPPRRVWNGDGISTVFRPYVAAMRAVAAECGVPCVDLYAAGCALLQQQGEAASTVLFCSDKDRSHFSAAGAQAMARLVAEGLLAQGDPVRSLLRPGEQWPTPATAAR